FHRYGEAAMGEVKGVAPPRAWTRTGRVTPERFRRVDELVSLALERAANERAKFIRDACAGDEDLRLEVQSLLASHEKEDEFLAEAPAKLAGQLLAERGQLDGSRTLTSEATSPSPAGARPDPFVGRMLSHYRIDAPLGSGGMGAVYRATDVALARAVAVKVLRHELANNGTAKARFIREARAASALDHSNIGTIYEIGEQDGELFIAMALYEGQTLKKRLEEGALPLWEAVDVLRQMSKGLEAAHHAGIIHRDIKPANVMLPSAGVLKILDFGLAKLAVDSVAQTVTQPGQAMGTLPYMPPEQLKGEAVDNRSDLWSLGVVGYETLADVCPFRAESNVAAAMRILSEEPPSLSAVPGVPTWLAALISQLLQKDAAKRLDSASKVITQLDQQLAYPGARAGQSLRLPTDLEQKSPESRIQSAEGVIGSLDRSSTVTQAPMPRVVRRWALLLAALLALAGASAVVVLWPRIKSSIQQAAPSHIGSRPIVAVLGFKNNSGRSDTAWVSTALSELMARELAAGEQLI